MSTTQNSNTKSAKLESLLKKHAALLTKTRRELAMNFDVPARDIIGMACAEMGINESTWRAMESHRISEEEATLNGDVLAQEVL